MNYIKTNLNLDSIPIEYYLINYDTPNFDSNEKISIIFNNLFHTKDILPTKYSDDIKKWKENDYCGDCYIEGNVLTLIAQKDKDFLNSLETALIVCGIKCIEEKINKIAIPINALIINEKKLMELITDIFINTDFEILQYKL